jgi:hypothetical protein
VEAVPLGEVVKVFEENTKSEKVALVILAAGGLDCIRTCQAGFNLMMIKDIKNA